MGKPARDPAAGASGTPGRHKTLDKVGEVKRVAQAPDTPEPGRKVAEQALREMAHTGRVDGVALATSGSSQPVATGQSYWV